PAAQLVRGGRSGREAALPPRRPAAPDAHRGAHGQRWRAGGARGEAHRRRHGDGRARSSRAAAEAPQSLRMMVRGDVGRQAGARGAKAERAAVLLRTADGEYVLRRQGGHPLRDTQLEALVGHTIEGEGVVRDYVLILSSWRVVARARRARRLSPRTGLLAHPAAPPAPRGGAPPP